jgi:hypothetical protein
MINRASGSGPERQRMDNIYPADKLEWIKNIQNEFLGVPEWKYLEESALFYFLTMQAIIKRMVV